MISKIKGQSLIEYALLAMLVIVGTLVMGPYLIRSVNSHFQLWQESIDDSRHDRMIPGQGVTIPPTCTCDTFQDGSCGGRFQRIPYNCPITHMYQFTPCTPPGCGFTTSDFRERCVENIPVCCSYYQLCFANFRVPPNPDPGCCGRIPLDDPQCIGRPTSGDFAHVPNPTTSPPNYSGFCCYNEEALINNCFPNDPDYIRCRAIPPGSNSPDAGRCRPRCINPIADSTACNTPPEGSDLNRDTPFRLVSDDCVAQPGAVVHRDGAWCVTDYWSPGRFTFTVPSFINSIFVYAWGAGGGGGGGGNDQNGSCDGSGGGGGGMVFSGFDGIPVPPNQNLTVTVGNGGLGGRGGAGGFGRYGDRGADGEPTSIVHATFSLRADGGLGGDTSTSCRSNQPPSSYGAGRQPPNVSGHFCSGAITGCTNNKCTSPTDPNSCHFMKGGNGGLSQGTLEAGCGGGGAGAGGLRGNGYNEPNGCSIPQNGIGNGELDPNPTPGGFGNYCCGPNDTNPVTHFCLATASCSAGINSNNETGQPGHAPGGGGAGGGGRGSNQSATFNGGNGGNGGLRIYVPASPLSCPTTPPPSCLAQCVEGRIPDITITNCIKPSFRVADWSPNYVNIQSHPPLQPWCFSRPVTSVTQSGAGCNNAPYPPGSGSTPGARCDLNISF